MSKDIPGYKIWGGGGGGGGGVGVYFEIFQPCNCWSYKTTIVGGLSWVIEIAMYLKFTISESSIVCTCTLSLFRSFLSSWTTRPRHPPPPIRLCSKVTLSPPPNKMTSLVCQLMRYIKADCLKKKKKWKKNERIFSMFIALRI